MSEAVDLLWAVIERTLAILICMGILLIFDRTISSTKARWFSIHAFANLLVSVFSIPALVQWLSDPVTSMSYEKFPSPPIFDASQLWHENTLWVTAMVLAVHIYHVVAFTAVNVSDIWHHLLFVPAIGGSGLLLPWGPLRQVLGFFISGLPGGIDYFNLVLYRHGMMSKTTKKRVSMLLAIFIRAPGLILVGFCMYQAKLYGETEHGWFMVIVVVLFTVGETI
jgi:hypothetical protein